MKTLAEILEAREIEPKLYDAATGQLIAEDRPDQYQVIREIDVDTLVVRGPSGQLDECDLTDGCRLRRDAH